MPATLRCYIRKKEGLFRVFWVLLTDKLNLDLEKLLIHVSFLLYSMIILRDFETLNMEHNYSQVRKSLNKCTAQRNM